MKSRPLYLRRICLALLVMGMGNPAAQAADAKLAAALAAAKAQNTELAVQLFGELATSQPKNNIYLFNYANALFLRGDYRLAAENYRQVSTSSSPLAVPARVYLWKCLRRLGQDAEARATLAQIPRASLGPALARELDAETALPTLFPSARFSAGYDSNFYADPENQTSDPTGKAVFAFDGQLRQQLAKSASFAWTARYSASYDGPISPAPDRTLGYALESEFALARGQQLFVVTPGFAHYFRNTDRYYLQPGATANYRLYQPAYTFGLNYRFARPLAAESALSFISGQTHEFTALLSSRTGTCSYGGSFSYNLNHTGDYISGTTLIPLRYHGYGPSAFLGCGVGGWDLSSRLDYRRRFYTNAYQPGGERRKDHYFATSFAGEHKLTGQLAGFVNVNLAWNHSTMGPSQPADKNYDQVAGALGLHWSLP